MYIYKQDCVRPYKQKELYKLQFLASSSIFNKSAVAGFHSCVIFDPLI